MRRFTRPTPATWAISLLAAGLAGNWLFSCGSNLVAFAVIAVVTLRFRVAAIIALGVWLESQILGFTAFGYSREPMTFAWGAALGVATLVATGVSGWLAGRTRLGAFVAAFGTYELALVAFALVTRSGRNGFTPAIIAHLFASNALIAIGAFILYVAIGGLESAIVSGARSRRHA